jgi:DNA-binding MurR/RpiR family transcriptional regulator
VKNKDTLMTTIDPRAVGARIRMRMPHLTPLERRVVETITGRTNFGETTSIRDVAADADVSEPMIVKSAKKLGFVGYRDFRNALIEYNRSDTAGLYSEISPDDSASEIVSKVFRSSMQALEETLAILDIEAFERAATMLHKARRLDFYGIGGSAQIARDAAHKFLRIGIHVNMHDDVHMMLMSASLLGPDDVVLAFSHSGATRAVLEPLQLARENGARSIAITNYADSPIASIVDVVLCSTAQGSPLLGENAAARIAQLNILDALFVVIAQRSAEQAEANLAKTMKAIEPRRKR